MADNRVSLSLGRSERVGGDGTKFTAPIVAAMVTVLWLGACALVLLLADPGEGGARPHPVFVLLGILVPVGLIWLCAGGTLLAQSMRHEIERQRALIETLRREVAAGRKEPSTSAWAEMAVKLAEVAESQDRAEWALKRALEEGPVQRAPEPPAAPHAAGMAQPGLGLETPQHAAEPAMSVEDFIAALQFPADPEDRDGFRALGKALRDRDAAQLVTSAQDALTLLSQDGIYMDDLPAVTADPHAWRAFARGEGGPEGAALAARFDEGALDRIGARMRQDTIFRDTAHHFLRLFDQTLTGVEAGLTDPQTRDLMDTRSGRVFVILGCVIGTFR